MHKNSTIPWCLLLRLSLVLIMSGKFDRFWTMASVAGSVLLCDTETGSDGTHSSNSIWRQNGEQVITTTYADRSISLRF